MISWAMYGGMHLSPATKSVFESTMNTRMGYSKQLC